MRCGRCNRCHGRTKQVFQQAQRVSIGPARGFPHRAGQQAALVVIEGIGSYGAGLSDRVLAAGLPVAEPSVMGSADRRGVGKTDDLDAARIARSVLSVDIDRLRRPRADGSRVAMRVLVVAREQMTCERTRAVNALTALVRTVELGVDARKSLAYSQIKEIATWRSRSEDATTATCRAEAVRLAKRIRALDSELIDNRKSLDELVKTNAPELHCRGWGGRSGCSDRPDRVVTCRSGALRSRVRLTRRDLPGPGFIR